MHTLEHVLILGVVHAALRVGDPCCQRLRFLEVTPIVNTPNQIYAGLSYAGSADPKLLEIPSFAVGSLNRDGTRSDTNQRATTNPLRLAQTPSQEHATNPPLTRADMEADLEDLTLRLKRAWAYADDKRAWLGVDIDALHTTARRELAHVFDADGFYFLVRKYVAGLMDGHAGVRPGHESRGLSTPFRWPFSVIRLGGRFYVRALDSDAGPLRSGDELLTLNGVGLPERFETALARSTGSTSAGREYRALGAMRYGVDRRLRFEVARPGVAKFTCDLEALTPEALRAQPEEPIRWKRLENEVGYLRLPSFAQDMKIWNQGGRGPSALQAALESKKSALREAFVALRDTPALILDLRGNSGGSDALGHFLAHCLCDTRAHPIYYTLFTRDSEDLRALPDFAYRTNLPASAAKARSQIALLPEKGVQRYRGKLAVLMDEGCFSACDCFLNYLAVAAPETLFVGRPNGAGAGAPRPVVTLPHSKMVITFCVMQVWNLRDELIESRPLKPTVPVSWTPDDLRRGRDPDLAAALLHLKGGS